MEAGDATSCYTSGSVAGAVFGTLLTVLVLAGLAYLFWRFYWRRRRGKHLSLETVEKGENAATAGPLGDRFAFDNPCFLPEDASPNRKNKKGAPKIKADGTQGKGEKNVKSDKGGGTGRLGKWTSWSPLGALVGGGGTNSKGNEKRRAFDDSCIGEPERVSVSLRGHDFTGLGFNVCGNMRDGIFVRDVLHRGPASESGQITAGDRIVSLGISFEHMVFEDALTILSYASPYEVLLQVEKGASPPGSTLLAGTDISSGQTSLKRTAASTAPSGAGASHSPDKQRAIICHPFYRSQSIDDLDKIGKASINAKRAQQIAEMTRVKSNTQDEMNHGSTRGGTAEVEGRSHHKDVEDEKLQRRDAPSLPSEEDTKRDGETGAHHTGYQKFGVRVLPMGNPSAGTHSQGVGKVHNPGHHNSPAVGSRPDRAEEVSITIATPEPQKQNERNSMIEMGVGKEVKVVAPPHNPANSNSSSKSPDDAAENNPKEESVKASITKMKMQATEELEALKTHESGTKNPHDDKEDEAEGQDQKTEGPDKMTTEGMIFDVPEEVCMAAMAAVTNRKMGGASQQNKEEEEEVTKHNGRVRYSSGGSGDEGTEDSDRLLGNTSGNAGKRRAPAPPAELSEVNTGDSNIVPFTSEATTDEEPPLCIPVSEERKKKGGTRIELGLDHITIHHQPQPSEEMTSTNTEEGETIPPESVVIKDEKENTEGDNSMTTGEENSSDTEADDAPTAKRTVTTVSGGKAASLGDLSRLEGGEVHRPPRMRAGPSSVNGGGEGVVLERAVSLDLGNAEEVVTGPPPNTSIGSAKKRKAPAPPTPVSRGNSNGSDEIDGTSRTDTGLDGDDYGKEPRLIGIGTTDTFGRRLKKSSDWGTMEEALLAGGSPSSSSTSSSTSAGRTILHLGSVPSFIPLSISDGVSHDFGTLASEVSTTRTVEAPKGGSELMASMLKKINSHPEISLQSSVITSSDTDGDANSTVTSTSEMPKTSEEQMNSPSSVGGNRVIVTTSASVDETIDSTTYPSQQNNRGVRGIVHLEAADTANSYIGGEGDKAEPIGESFHSSFQRAREFFEREDDKTAITPMEEDDDDDEVTSSPPSLPTSPMPTMQPSSPLSLHSTTTYISSIEDIPVVPGLLDGREFGVTTHSAPGAQHHITEIQVRTIDEDGKKIETREVVVSQDGNKAFGRVGDIISSAIERNPLSSSGEKFSVAAMKIPKVEGELQSNMYINESFPATEGAKEIHQIGYKLTSNMPEPHYQVGKPSSNATDNGSIDASTSAGTIVGSSDQVTEEIGNIMDAISSSEIMGDTGSPIVQIRMREGPSGWIPYRHRNSQGEERGDGKKEISEGSGEPPKVPKKKPPVPPRKDASNSSTSESPNRSDTSIGSSFSSSVKTVVEVPMSFTKRLVQVHETRNDDGVEGMEGRQEQPMHRISEREVIQITPQELDKVMMSHSQFLSHKRGEPSPMKSEQWLPGTTSTRSVVHRIVEQWVTDEDGMRKIITETSVGDGGESVTEVIESEGGTATPPNGIVSTVSDGNAIDATSELHKQNMSVTRILVDPEFASNLGRSSDGVTKTINVANLQLSGIEGKPSIPSSGLQT